MCTENLKGRGFDMYDETSLQTKVLIGVVIILFCAVWFQHCRYASKIQSLESKVIMVECVKQCLQDSK